MKSKQKHLAVAGNIGAGKTTLVRLLSAHYSWEPHFESVDDNPYLEDFYQDMSQWAFPLQIHFLNSRFNQIRALQKKKNSVIQDRTIYEDAHIFARNLYESGHKTQRDYENYLRLFNTMSELVSAPDLLIYLKADLPVLTDRIAKRGRDYEQQINLKYLESLNRLYEDWISSYQEGPLLVVNVNNLDFEHRPEDFGFIVDKINAELFGLFSV